MPSVYLKYMGCGGPLDKSPDAKDPRIEVRFGSTNSTKPMYLTHCRLYHGQTNLVTSMEQLMEQEPSKSFKFSYECDRVYGSASAPFCWTRPGHEALYVIRPVSTDDPNWVKDVQRFAYQNNLHFKIKSRSRATPSWIPSFLAPEETTVVYWHR
jgi:hypothetical protein